MDKKELKEWITNFITYNQPVGYDKISMEAHLKFGSIDFNELILTVKELQDEGRIYLNLNKNFEVANNTEGKQNSEESAWTEIQEAFDISKRSFAKKINFITDSFKRQIIMRDIEQAFVLAKYSYNKPAVILAGSVIEELLRLFLLSKGVKPSGNTFAKYVEDCEKHSLLKDAIRHLSSSVRHFRNLVHLEQESSPKHTISKATATGAVASIFTIVNDFA